MKENRHTAAIPVEDIEQIEFRVQEILDILKPHVTIGLTAQDRMNLPKMGTKNLDFIGTAFDTARKNPNMLPVHADINEFELDYRDARQLFELENSLKTMMQKVNDLAMLAGSEALQAALMVYASVRLATDQKIPGAKALYETMKAKYPKGGRRRTANTGETEQN